MRRRKASQILYTILFGISCINFCLDYALAPSIRRGVKITKFILLILIAKDVFLQVIRLEALITFFIQKQRLNNAALTHPAKNINSMQYVHKISVEVSIDILKFNSQCFSAMLTGR
jgi:hypothetical protein